MNDIGITLHAPHLPPAGIACRAQFAGNVLLIDGPEPQRVPADTLEVSTGGFHDDLLFLSWQYDGVKYSANTADPAVMRALFAMAPPELQPKLRQGHREMSYHQRKWRTIVGVLGLLALAVALAWWQSDALTGWLAKQVSLKTEQRLGQALLAQVAAEGTLGQTGAAAEALESIGGKLTQGSRYQYEWYISDDATINAFAIPGGIVVVNSGLIAKTSSADELAGVLAHEVQHVERRHTLQQMIHTAGWAAVLAVALGDVSAISGVLIHQLGNLRNSRKLESEADREGLLTLARVGIPLDGMARFLKRLNVEQEKEGNNPDITLLSTHPATAERLAEIENLVKTTPCDCRPLVYDWDAVRTSLEQDNDEAAADAKD